MNAEANRVDMSCLGSRLCLTSLIWFLVAQFVTPLGIALHVCPSLLDMHVHTGASGSFPSLPSCLRTNREGQTKRHKQMNMCFCLCRTREMEGIPQQATRNSDHDQTGSHRLKFAKS